MGRNRRSGLLLVYYATKQTMVSSKSTILLQYEKTAVLVS